VELEAERLRKERQEENTMPRPQTVEKRNHSKQVLNHIQQVLDDNNFLDAIEEVEGAPPTNNPAARDPQGYLRGKGVTIPGNLHVESISTQSPVLIEFSGFGIRIRIQW
jgi:hypothetical protein